MKRTLAIILTTLLVMELASQEAPVKWLTRSPDIAQGQSWGIPWQKGKVQKNQMFVLKTSSGKARWFSKMEQNGGLFIWR
jgi:hypothetical protein